jgi:hypothetical protein
MSTVPLRALQGLLIYVGLSHIVIGGGAMLSADFQKRVADLYGVTVALEPQAVYLARVLGAFMLVLGVLALAAVRDPARYGPVIYGLAGVLLLRDVQRVVHREEIVQTFGIDQGWNLGVGAFFLALAVALVVLFQVVRRGASPIAGPARAQPRGGVSP